MTDFNVQVARFTHTPYYSWGAGILAGAAVFLFWYAILRKYVASDFAQIILLIFTVIGLALALDIIIHFMPDYNYILYIAAYLLTLALVVVPSIVVLFAAK